MTSTTLAPTARPLAIPIGQILPWLAFAQVLMLAIYFVGAEEGATSLIKGMAVHEFLHDGRHLLGFPATEGADMVGKLLVRGMLVGIIAGLLSFAFLKVVGEPEVDRAIAFETQMDAVKAKAVADQARAKGLPVPAEDAEPEIVSRPTQAGIGLLTGVSVYNVAFGGLFALAFALLYGRMGHLGPRATSAVMAAMGFLAVYVVPNLKYPANPPSVGDAETIGIRTGLYFSMILISLVAMVASSKLRGSILHRFGNWNATILAAGFYVSAVSIASLLLPGINEVPEAFPAVVLWQFRVASFGAQLIMWTTIGLLFGALAERLLVPRPDGLPSGRQVAV